MGYTSTVFPLAAWRMSPGRMPLPSIMFSHDAVMMCTCSGPSIDYQWLSKCGRSRITHALLF